MTGTCERRCTTQVLQRPNQLKRRGVQGLRTCDIAKDSPVVCRRSTESLRSDGLVCDSSAAWTI